MFILHNFPHCLHHCFLSINIPAISGSMKYLQNDNNPHFFIAYNLYLLHIAIKLTLPHLTYAWITMDNATYHRDTASKRERGRDYKPI